MIVAPVPTLIGTRRGERGVVMRHGRVLGKVFAHSRVAAGKKGARAPFFTATPSYPSCLLGDGPSLGTRFATRHAAVAALVAFDRSYPPVLIQAMAERGKWYSDDPRHQHTCTLFDAVRKFKSDRKRAIPCAS